WRDWWASARLLTGERREIWRKRRPDATLLCRNRRQEPSDGYEKTTPPPGQEAARAAASRAPATRIPAAPFPGGVARSEERRVGKEGRSGVWTERSNSRS